MAKHVTGADIFGGMFQNIPGYERGRKEGADPSGKHGGAGGGGDSGIALVDRGCLNPFHSFYGHPFRVEEDFAMEELAESIRELGIMEPILVRPEKGERGGYEIISGHRRNHAAGLAQLKEVPVRIMELSDEEAAEIMVDSNNKREHILPSEKAWAYRTKAEAARRQGRRTDLQADAGEGLEGGLAKGMDSVGGKNGDSVQTVRRYIRLTYLLKELLELVDEGRIPLGTGYALSFLNGQEQECILDYYHARRILPDASQAKQLLECRKEQGLDAVAVERIMAGAGTEKTAKTRITIKQERLREYFPEEATPEYMESVILELLEKWRRENQGG